MIVAAIRPKMVSLIWHVVVPFLESAIEYSNDELEIERMKEEIEKGVAVLLTIYDGGEIVAAATIKIEKFHSGKKVLTIVALGGVGFDLWNDVLFEALCRISKEEGCSELYVIGRPGWAKALKSFGFNKIHTVMAKQIQ